MKTSALTLFLSAVLAASAVAGGIAEARRAFERDLGAPFANAVLVAESAAAPAASPARAPGKATFRFALPYADDARLQFVTAEFDGGTFASGRLHVLGFEPQTIGAAAFEKLRDTQPMVAVRMGTEEISPCAVLFPARQTAATFVTDDDRNLSVNPLRRQLGWLADSLGRLGVSTAKLACRVKLTTRDGLEVDLGEATLKAPVSEKTVMTNVRAAMERREPARKGRISDRDVVDCRHGASVSCCPTEDQRKKECQ